MSIDKQGAIARQAGLCARMMERIEAHVINPTTRRDAGLSHSWNSGAFADETPRGYGCLPEEITADIRHLRRELLALSKMVEGVLQ